MDIPHAQTQTFFSERSNLDKNCFLFICVFLDDEEREDLNNTIGEPSSAFQRIAISMTFCWFADDDLTFNPCYVAL